MVKTVDWKLETASCEGSNPTEDKNFSFCYFRLFRVPRTWAGHIQMKSSMTFIRDKRCIESEKDNFTLIPCIELPSLFPRVRIHSALSFMGTCNMGEHISLDMRLQSIKSIAAMRMSNLMTGTKLLKTECWQSSVPTTCSFLIRQCRFIISRVTVFSFTISH